MNFYQIVLLLLIYSSFLFPLLQKSFYECTQILDRICIFYVFNHLSQFFFILRHFFILLHAPTALYFSFKCVTYICISFNHCRLLLSCTLLTMASLYHSSFLFSSIFLPPFLIQLPVPVIFQRTRRYILLHHL